MKSGDYSALAIASILCVDTIAVKRICIFGRMNGSFDQLCTGIPGCDCKVLVGRQLYDKDRLAELRSNVRGEGADSMVDIPIVPGSTAPRRTGRKWPCGPPIPNEARP